MVKEPDQGCRLGGAWVSPPSGASVDHFGQHIIGIVNAEISSLEWQLAQLPHGAGTRAELNATLQRR